MVTRHDSEEPGPPSLSLCAGYSLNKVSYLGALYGDHWFMLLGQMDWIPCVLLFYVGFLAYMTYSGGVNVW